MGSSYFVESLTNEMEQRVEDYLGKIKKQGGIVAAVANGWVHAEITDSAVAYQRAIEAKEMLVVGVNCCTVEAGASRWRSFAVRKPAPDRCSGCRN